jgi:hypothetical protein
MAYSYDRTRVGTDFKAFLRKLLAQAEKDLKGYMTGLGVNPSVVVQFETPPPRGGYGPYEVGTLRVDRFEVRVTVDLSKEEVSIGASSGSYVHEKLWSKGTTRDAGARLKKVLDFVKEEIAREAAKEKPKEAPALSGEDGSVWSVVTLGKGHSYATEVDTFGSKAKAEAEARDRGDCYVVKGTQMWNEPLGQVEEHDRTAPSKYFR